MRSRGESLRRRHPLLHDPDALRAAVEDRTVDEIAHELGVARSAVTRAMQRHSVASPRQFDGAMRTQRPTPEHLIQLWETHSTVKAVAVECGVSPTTARVWLAEAGCFVSDVGALSRRDLTNAIAAGDSLRTIAQRFGVTDFTVLVELHRYGLFTNHRRRSTLERRRPPSQQASNNATS